MPGNIFRSKKKLQNCVFNVVKCEGISEDYY